MSGSWGRRWTPEAGAALQSRRRAGGGTPPPPRPAIVAIDHPPPTSGSLGSLHVERKPAKTKGKYGGTITEVDGIRFDSKLEARLYTRLSVLLADGRILAFLRQVPLHLPGGIVLRVDFLVQTHSPERPVRILDSKGYLTDAARIKVAVAEATYPWPIELLKGRAVDTWEPEVEPAHNATREKRVRAEK